MNDTGLHRCSEARRQRLQQARVLHPALYPGRAASLCLATAHSGPAPCRRPHTHARLLPPQCLAPRYRQPQCVSHPRETHWCAMMMWLTVVLGTNLCWPRVRTNQKRPCVSGGRTSAGRSTHAQPYQHHKLVQVRQHHCLCCWCNADVVLVSIIRQSYSRPKAQHAHVYLPVPSVPDAPPELLSRSDAVRVRLRDEARATSVRRDRVRLRREDGPDADDDDDAAPAWVVAAPPPLFLEPAAPPPPPPPPGRVISSPDSDKQSTMMLSQRCCCP